MGAAFRINSHEMDAVRKAIFQSTFRFTQAGGPKPSLQDPETGSNNGPFKSSSLFS